VRARILTKHLEAVGPVLLGIGAFFAVVGPRALYPTNIAWLSSGDPAQHFLGWHFFRNSDWSFPIGLNPKFGLELSNAIVFSDSNPLLAFLFKPFAKLLPQTFQYFGIWLMACFILQAWFGWKLVGLIGGKGAARLFSAGLFVFTPPMIWRHAFHLSLVGHFLILAGLYLTLRPRASRSVGAWACLLAVASLVHAYFVAMIAALWVANLFQAVVCHRYSALRAITEITVVVVVVGLVCWQAGYFSMNGGLDVEGYGCFKLNLLSPVDPSGWSYLLKDIPQAAGEYEGFNFLGLGVIILILTALPGVLSGRLGLISKALDQPALMAVLLALFLFALSNNIGIGAQQIEFRLPATLLRIPNVFRGSGRMFWPLFYVLVLTAVFVTVRGNTSGVAASLLAIVLVVQIADTRAGWAELRKHDMLKTAAEWASPLKDVFWKKAATKYRNVRWIMPGNMTQHWQMLAAYAAKNAMGTDAVYLGRMGRRQLENARAEARKHLASGNYECDSLYVLNPAYIGLALLHLDQANDLLAEIDGLYVVAPGWKSCRECGSPANEVDFSSVLSLVDLGERITFSENTKGTKLLTDGWSTPGELGTWSDAETAAILLPLAGVAPSSLIIEGNALVTSAHPKQRVEITVEGIPVAVLDITCDSEGGFNFMIPERINIALSEDLRQIVTRSGILALEFRFPDAVRPSDLGLNRDKRLLGFHLIAIELIQ
jgi:hypothetical protein